MKQETKVQAAAKLLLGENILHLTDAQVMEAGHQAGIALVGRWHLTRIRNARTLLEVDVLLGR